MARIGIDLGTTNSVGAGFFGRDEADVFATAQGRIVPSAVCPTPRGMLVGVNAKAKLHFFYSIKRLIGRRYDDPEVAKVRAVVPYEILCAEANGGRSDEILVKLGDTVMSPVQVSAEILKHIKRNADAYYLGEPVTHAVITVPANFLDGQKCATREAGALAGLKVIQILDEPTAAALAFGVARGGEGLQRVLVYDLGGGTFDVSIITIADGLPLVETTRGDMWCGGDDFDNMIVDRVLEEVESRQRGVAAILRAEFRWQLKGAAEAAKKELDQTDSAFIDLTYRKGDTVIPVEASISRSEFNAMIRPKLVHTIELLHLALKNAQLAPEDIDSVLLVGGSTASPLVREMLAAEFGLQKVRRDINPMECVALGAALRAREQTSIICPRCTHRNDEDADRCGGALEDGTPCREPLGAVAAQSVCPKCKLSSSAGAIRCDHCGHVFMVTQAKTPLPIGIAGHGDRYKVIIPKDTDCPMAHPIYEPFRTTEDGQPVIVVLVYEGENEAASKNAFLGRVLIRIPTEARGPSGLQVNLGLAKDTDNVVVVSARGVGPLAAVNVDVPLKRARDLPSDETVQKLRTCPVCGDNNDPAASVCQACEHRFLDQPEDRFSPDEAWKEGLGISLTWLQIVLNDCTWFLKAEDIAYAESMKREGEDALAHNDEAQGRLIEERIDRELAVGRFGGVADIIRACVLWRAGIHVTTAQRARFGELLSRFKEQATHGQMNAAEQTRRELRTLINEVLTRRGERPPDWRPEPISALS